MTLAYLFGIEFALQGRKELCNVTFGQLQGRRMKMDSIIFSIEHVAKTTKEALRVGKRWQVKHHWLIIVHLFQLFVSKRLATQTIV